MKIDTSLTGVRELSMRMPPLKNATSVESADFANFGLDSVWRAAPPFREVLYLHPDANQHANEQACKKRPTVPTRNVGERDTFSLEIS